MRRILNAALGLLVALTLTTARAVENTWDPSVQVSATVQSSPARITLSWPQDTNGVPSNYTIYRRSVNSSDWGSGTTVSGSSTSYVDSGVSAGAAYEYRIVKAANGYKGTGYITAGVEAPLVDSRGKVVLVVDNTFASSLAGELARLEQDLVGDGWGVIRRDVGRDDSVPSVKAAIKSAYDSDPANVKAVFLFGRVPVPYSGQLNPDGHSDHLGAWPADVYYGDMDGNWTDSSVNYIQSINTSTVDAQRLSNVPGDGKFDQTTLPSSVELMVGRVDLSKMPGRTTWGGPATFPNETELLRKYLNKDHNFRHRRLVSSRRAIIGDYFGYRNGEAFSASAYRSFAPLVGADQVRNLNVEFNDQRGVWIPQAAQNDYLLAYGAGAGGYDSISGLGNSQQYNGANTTELVSNNVRGVFNLLFGSWLGDWDVEDNILRSPLATDYGLTAAWSGRPHWFMHPMGLGETIGYVTRLTQNNTGQYETIINSSQNRVHISLLGDPTLRLHPVVPVSNLNGSANGSTVALTWSASSDSAIVGYHVYRASSAGASYTRLTSTPTTETNFTDNNGSASANYMVRAVKLETGASGTYYNASQGLFWPAGSTGSGTTPEPTPTPTPGDSTAGTGGSTTTPTPSPDTSTPGTTTPDTSTPGTTTPGTGTAGVVTWFDDALPAGAAGTGVWNWVDSNPTPISGTKAHQTAVASGQHEYAFSWGETLAVKTGEVIFAHVYLDPANPPSEIMFSFVADNWEHRAYWGSNDINYGADGTAGRRHMGALPAAGQWVRLEIPASAVALEGQTVQGMGLTVFNGRMTLDYVGKADPAALTATTPTDTTAPSTDTTTAPGANSIVWFDDALPAGASGSGAWNWVASNPAPFTGSASHQTGITAGLHEYAFNWGTSLAVKTGQVLFAHVYLDPANPPSEIMFSFVADNWEHRAYWGSNDISYGTNGTAGRHSMGALPAAGQWVRLEIPASAVGLEGQTVQGMSLSVFNGRVNLDQVGVSDPSSTGTTTPTTPTDTTTPDATAPVTSTPDTTVPTTPPADTTTPPTAPAAPAENVWFDDALPAGASGGASGGDAWLWVANDPAPASGSVSHQSNIKKGLHEHYFNFASQTLPVATGDKLFAYVYIDPANPPSEIMISWCSNNWEHRAYWGADNIKNGKKDSASRYNAGALPAAGQWVRLEVPASAVGLEGHNVQGMSFSVYDGRVTWDKTGTTSTTSATGPEPTPTAPSTPEFVWLEDSLPAGASGGGTGGDAWNWISSNPTPYSGSMAQQSINAAGLHETSFNWAGTAMNVAAGESLFAYVYIDPVNTPSSIMLSWNNGDWEHRAYWGANKINYGNEGTASRYYVGPLPAAGQWARLEVPASAVALEGSSVTGMSLSVYDGRVTFDKIGKGGSSGTTTPTEPTSPTSPTEPAPTQPAPTEPAPAPTPTEPAPTTPPPTEPGTTPPTVIAENAAFRLPQVGDHQLTVVSPTILELRRVTTKQPDPATVAEWNFVNSSGVFSAPSTSEFAVTVNGQANSVKNVGFRRRVAYAPEHYRDLRIDNTLYLELSSPIAETAAVEVKNPSGALWTSGMEFKSTADALRYSPAIHVNQEGYVPSLPKKAMVGYYLGNLGELEVNAGAGFKLVNAATGATVHSGSLTVRRETGFNYSPMPYQKVLEADFSSFSTPGEYQLVVPGLGASFPFLINEGVAMAFTRTYALGLYHQRCGAECKMPFSRFDHAACHMAAAEIPSPQSSYAFTWTTIASKNEDAKNNPRHTAPRLQDEASQLYPFVNKGTVDVSGGHHDAGDYSKYTSNVAQLVHQLAFTGESIKGASALDNLGLPESGDGISDILQEAKQEADYLAKLQDADGGFYFIVYPKTRAYEGGVTPDKGDQQVVWPKNTSASAAGVAALAQIASSPKFKAAYPAAAAMYLEKAKLGWQFLTNAIAKHGKDGAYQKVTFYSDNHMHDDELAWAAAEMFVATGDAQYHQKLMEWFPNPSDPATFRYGWWRMNEAYGNAIRAYAFAARSGRLSLNQLDAGYLAKCEEQIKLCGDDQLKWSNQSAYGTSFPEASRHVLGAGWYFSLDQASDLAVAYQLNPKPEYVDALVANLNYEGGTNPVNVTMVTGLGLKRQREIVNQWSNSDHRSTPMPGIPVGNFASTFSYIGIYGAQGNELSKLSFPTDDTGNPASMYPIYDRWADNWNVTAEFITVNQARALTSSAMLASLTSAANTAWKPTSTAKIVVPTTTVQTGALVTLALDGVDLSNARVMWEARDNEPDFGATYTITPKNPGAQFVEVEITWADGRRMFGTATFNAFSPLVTWLDDAIPLGANPGATGGDVWNWTASTNPAPQSGLLLQATPAGSGLREHSFSGAWTTLPVGTNDTMFVWVYLDPAAMPEQLMLSWNNGTWEHRAYWGADKISYGTKDTASRRNMGALPAGGSWVKLEVPASAVGLEGTEVNGMSFSTYGGGRVLWDATGRTSPIN